MDSRDRPSRIDLLKARARTEGSSQPTEHSAVNAFEAMIASFVPLALQRRNLIVLGSTFTLHGIKAIARMIWNLKDDKNHWLRDHLQTHDWKRITRLRDEFVSIWRNNGASKGRDAMTLFEEAFISIIAAAEAVVRRRAGKTIEIDKLFTMKNKIIPSPVIKREIAKLNPDPNSLQIRTSRTPGESCYLTGFPQVAPSIDIDDQIHLDREQLWSSQSTDIIGEQHQLTDQDVNDLIAKLSSNDQSDTRQVSVLVIGDLTQQNIDEEAHDSSSTVQSVMPKAAKKITLSDLGIAEASPSSHSQEKKKRLETEVQALQPAVSCPQPLEFEEKARLWAEAYEKKKKNVLEIYGKKEKENVVLLNVKRLNLTHGDIEPFGYVGPTITINIRQEDFFRNDSFGPCYDKMLTVLKDKVDYAPFDTWQWKNVEDTHGPEDPDPSVFELTEISAEETAP